MTDEASRGLWWVVSIAASVVLSCGQRAEPVASTGTSEVAAAPPAAAYGNEPNGTPRPGDTGDSQPPAVEGCAANTLGAVRTISPTHCEVPRSLLLDDDDCLLSRPQLVPHAVEGRTVGFRHDSIPSRSIYAACGIRSGDVWTKLNGEPLDSPDQALRLYPSLRDSQRLTIELLRGSQSFEVVIELR